MRIGIREQLAVVLLVTALLPLAVLAVVVWINNYNFVVNVTSQELTLTASLKVSVWRTTASRVQGRHYIASS